MSLAQNNGDREQLDHLITGNRVGAVPRAPSAEALEAALRARERMDAVNEAQTKPRGLRALYVALRGTWTGLETLAVVVPWFITLLTCVLAFAVPGLLVVVIIAQSIASLVSTAVVLTARRQR